MTTNPIDALKITSCNTKRTNHTKIYFQKSKYFEQTRKSHFQKGIFIRYQNSIINILYILYIYLYILYIFVSFHFGPTNPARFDSQLNSIRFN